MQVLFIYTLEEIQSTNKPLRTWSMIQFGISYISAMLKANGHQTELLVLGSNNAWRENENLLSTAILKFSPKVVAFTTVASQYPFVKKVARHLKTNWPHIYQIIGGVHVTLNPSEIIVDCFDALCIGEGEFPLLELCEQLQNSQTPKSIDNLWLKSPDGLIEKNMTRPFVQDLDQLPCPDRDMWLPWMKEQLGSELPPVSEFMSQKLD